MTEQAPKVRVVKPPCKVGDRVVEYSTQKIFYVFGVIVHDGFSTKAFTAEDFMHYEVRLSKEPWEPFCRRTSWSEFRTEYEVTRLGKICELIDGYLKKFEAELKAKEATGYRGFNPYSRASCIRYRERAAIAYVNHLDPHILTKVEAISYLAWLERGNVGLHWAI